MTEKTPIQQLWPAVESGNFDLARQLIVAHPEVLDDQEDAALLLHDAATEGHLSIVEMLIDAGVDVNAPNPLDRSTPLDSAAGEGQLEVAKWLLEHGAAICHGEDNRLPTLIFAERKSLEMVHLLLDRGVDVNASYSFYGEPMNALGWAEMNGKTDIATLLRKHGAVLPGEKATPPEEAQSKTGESFDPREEILQHYGTYLGPLRELALQEIVPAGDTVSVAIHVSSPAGNKNCVSLVTVGMSDQPMTVPAGEEQYRYAELMIHLPADWPVGEEALKDETYFWPFRWLRQVAYFPHENGTWLGGAHAVVANGEPPEPLGPGTQFTSLLLLTNDEEQSRLVSRDGRIIHFYNVYPLYTEERDLELNRGIVALLKAMDKHDIGAIVDSNRKNVAAKTRARRKS